MPKSSRPSRCPASASAESASPFQAVTTLSSRSGRGRPDAIRADWDFYLAYNLFRLAAILQGIAKRVEAGTAASDQARSAGAGAKGLAELAWRFAGGG